MKIIRVESPNKSIPCYGCVYYSSGLGCAAADDEDIVCHEGGQEYIFIKKDEDES